MKWFKPQESFRNLFSVTSHVRSHSFGRPSVLPITSVLDIIYQSVFSTIEKEFDILIPQSSSWCLTFLNYCQGYPSSLESCPFWYQHLQTAMLPRVEAIDSSYSLLCFYTTAYVLYKGTRGGRFRSVMWYSRKGSS